MKKLIIKMIYFVVLGYIGVVALLYVKQRSIMYFPQKNVPVPAEHGLEVMDVVHSVTSDGIDIAAWYYKAADPAKPTIILFHGNAGNIGIRDFKARMFIDAGYGIMLAGYRGYGGNTGKPTENGLYEDARAQMRWLVSHGVKPQNIVIYGESLGSGVATKMATEFPQARAVILETPYTSTVEVGQWRFPVVPVYLLMKDRFESIERIDEIRSPVLVLHGTKDRIVPFRYGLKLYEAANQPKHMEVFEGGGHNDLYKHGADQAILSFLENYKEQPLDANIAE